MSNLPELVYYDVNISNYESTTQAPPILKFDEKRSQCYLPNSGLYNMSIVRFELNTGTLLPVFIPRIQPSPNSDPNFTIYSLTLGYNGQSLQQFIKFEPQDISITVPLGPSSQPNGQQDDSANYYNIFSFQWFINMINTAFVSAMIALGEIDGIGELPSINAPFLNWDITTNSAILNADQAGFSKNLNKADSSVISIYFNNPLFNLFSSFMAIQMGYNATAGQNALLVIDDYTTGSNTIQLPISDPTYTAVQIYQDYSTVSLFSPISSVVFCSNLPIRPSQQSAPAVYYNSVLQSASSSSDYQPIISDFIANDSFYRPTLLYEPFFPRQIELIGNTALKDMSISVYWKDKTTGSLHPFYLTSGSSCSIKILFTLKDRQVQNNNINTIFSAGSMSRK